MHLGRSAVGAAAAALLAIGVWGAPAARAQDPNLGTDLGPPPRPVSVYLANRPTITVDFGGDYGPVRLTGRLDRAPQGTLRLTDATGRTRLADWSEVRSLVEVRTATEGLPLGTFSVFLVSDGGGATAGVSATGGYTSALASPVITRGGWRLSRLPEGELTVQAGALGSVNVPVSRISAFVQDPVRGSILKMPSGTVRVEVLAGRTLNVPLVDVELLRRDLKAGTISLTLADGQTVTGKLLEMPKVDLTFEGNQPPAIPIEQIVQLEVAVPGLSRRGVLGGAF